jgi:trimeric autotransporter adhesin
LACAGARGGLGDLNCPAGEFTATVSIAKAPGAPDTCVSGEYFFLDATIGLSGSNANRYNIGFFTGEDANDPQLAAGTCSVATFPTGPSPWMNYDSNACGDYLKAGVSTPLVHNLRVKCIADVSGQLQVPYVVTYEQNSGTCSGPGNVTSGSKSKCNAGTSTVSGIWVMPSITIDDGVTAVASGSTVTYLVVVSNTSGAAMSNLVIKDPVVSGIALSNVSCVATGGASCPGSTTVAGLQGATGLTIPSLPSGGSVTFTIQATLTGSAGSSLTHAVSGERHRYDLVGDHAKHLQRHR